LREALDEEEAQDGMPKKSAGKHERRHARSQQLHAACDEKQNEREQ
jgi:hypothetical protein